MTKEEATKYLNDIGKDRRIELLKTLKFDNVDDITAWFLTYTENSAWIAFCDLKDNVELSDEMFNYAFQIGYTIGVADDRLYDDDVISRVCINYCSKEEIELYKSLPETITIYRGTSIDEYDNSRIYGSSWSLSKKVAEFFAYRYNEDNRCVISLEIPKIEIKCLFIDRKEQEVFLDGELLRYDYDDATLVSKNMKLEFLECYDADGFKNFRLYK